MTDLNVSLFVDDPAAVRFYRHSNGEFVLVKIGDERGRAGADIYVPTSLDGADAAKVWQALADAAGQAADWHRERVARQVAAIVAGQAEAAAAVTP